MSTVRGDWRLEHISYSSLMTWERCRKKFFLEKIAQAPSRPAWYFAGGSAVHRLTEEIDLGDQVELEAGEGLTQAWRTTFYPEVKSLMEANGGIYGDTTGWLAGGSKEMPEDGDSWDQIGPLCVSNWMQFVKEELEEIQYVELDVSTRLPGVPVPIKGFVDRVALNKERKVGQLDIKSGKSNPKDAFQLDTYDLLLVVAGFEIEWSGFLMARTGKLHQPRKRTPFSEVKARYAKVATEILEATEFPADKQFSCRFCSVQDSCATFSGATDQAKYFDSEFK